MIFASIAGFWYFVGTATNWFGFGSKLDPFIPWLALPACLLSCSFIVFVTLRIHELIYGKAKPLSEYTRKDAAELLDYFLQGEWNYADDFDDFCATKFDDPLIQSVADEFWTVLANLPNGEKENQRLRELRDLLIASSHETILDQQREPSD